MPSIPDYEGLEDQALLAAVAGGDREAFRAFHARHAGRVLGYIRRTCNDPGLAEELAQETFIAVWQRADTYRLALGSPSSWLFTISRNKMIDHWRSRKAWVALDGLDLDKMFEVPIHQDEDLVLSLDQALMSLSAEQRKAVKMAYFGGLTYEETAKALALPIGTLKSRIRAGLAVLKAVLEGRP